MTIIEDFLTAISDELSLKKPVKEENEGTYSLRIGSNELLFRESIPGLAMWSTVAQIPSENREDLFIHLMQANFLGQGTGASAIGLDEKEKSLTLSLPLPYEMKQGDFREYLEDFLNYLEYWKDYIVSFQNKSSFF